MNHDAGHDDEELLRRLGAIARKADPVPDLVTDLARAAFSFRTLDAELAALVDDSADELVPVRGPELAERMLEFSARELRIELQLTELAGRRSMLGQVHVSTGARDVEVAVESSSGVTTAAVAVDALGRFSFDDLPEGSVRLRCRRPGSTPVVTPWLAPA